MGGDANYVASFETRIVPRMLFPAFPRQYPLSERPNSKEHDGHGFIFPQPPSRSRSRFRESEGEIEIFLFHSKLRWPKLWNARQFRILSQ